LGLHGFSWKSFSLLFDKLRRYGSVVLSFFAGSFSPQRAKKNYKE
jgi:hypothetical protein